MRLNDMNEFAKAWNDAAKDLEIRILHPFAFKAANGEVVTTQGVYLPDFGSKQGTLLTCRFDSSEVMELASETDYFESALNPHHYEPYNRETYIGALNDWGWFGELDTAPEWFTGGYGKHDGA